MFENSNPQSHQRTSSHQLHLATSARLTPADHFQIDGSKRQSLASQRFAYDADSNYLKKGEELCSNDQLMTSGGGTSCVPFHDLQLTEKGAFTGFHSVQGQRDSEGRHHSLNESKKNIVVKNKKQEAQKARIKEKVRQRLRNNLFTDFNNTSLEEKPPLFKKSSKPKSKKDEGKPEQQRLTRHSAYIKSNPNFMRGTSNSNQKIRMGPPLIQKKPRAPSVQSSSQKQNTSGMHLTFSRKNSTHIMEETNFQRDTIAAALQKRPKVTTTEWPRSKSTSVSGRPIFQNLFGAASSKDNSEKKSISSRKSEDPPLDPRAIRVASQFTLQLQYKQIQDAIEAAIMACSPNTDHLTRDQFKACLIELKYFPNLKRFDNLQNFAKLAKSTSLKHDLREERTLLGNLWLFLNPLGELWVGKASVYDYLLLLMFNVCHQSDRDLAYSLSEFLAEHYFQAFNLTLEEGPIEGGEGQSGQIFGLSDLQKVDRMIAKKKEGVSVARLVHQLKIAHQSRFSHKQFDDFLALNKGQGINPEFQKSDFQDNRSLQRVTPKDKRKYKGDSVKYLATNFTFTPRISEATEKLALGTRQKLIVDPIGRSSRKQSKANSDLQSLINQVKVPASCRSTPQLLDFQHKYSTMSNSQIKVKYEFMRYQQEVREQKIEAKKKQKQEKELGECTFAPKLNDDVQNVQSTYNQELIRKCSKERIQRQQEAKETGEPAKEIKAGLPDFLSQKKQLSRGAKMVKDRRDQREKEELKECTFQPKINKLNARKNNLFGIGKRDKENDPLSNYGGNHLEHVIENNVTKQMPKGYAKVVERLRRHQLVKTLSQKEQELQAQGMRYNSSKLARMKPPSFLSRQSGTQKKRKELLKIEVSVTPSRNGVITIKEGDNLALLAANFCKAYTLSKEMEVALLGQLKEHMINLQELSQQRMVRKQRRIERRIEKEAQHKIEEFEINRITEEETEDLPMVLVQSETTRNVMGHSRTVVAQPSQVQARSRHSQATRNQSFQLENILSEEEDTAIKQADENIQQTSPPLEEVEFLKETALKDSLKLTEQQTNSQDFEEMSVRRGDIHVLTQAETMREPTDASSGMAEDIDEADVDDVGNEHECLLTPEQQRLLL